MNYIYLFVTLFLTFHLTAEIKEEIKIQNIYEDSNVSKNNKGEKIKKNEENLKLIPIMKSTHRRNKNIHDYDNLFGLYYGYLYGKINFNTNSIKTDDVPLIFYFSHFLSPKTALDIEAMKIHGKRVNNRYLSPMYLTLKYSAFRKYNSNTIKASLGLNYYDNGIRREHTGIQRHSYFLFFGINFRHEFSKDRAVSLEIHSSPQLSYSVEVPKSTPYSATASYFKISTTYEFPSIIIPATLTLHGNFQNYYYRFKEGNESGKSDKILFLALGILKKF
jgi:hypothetical protein